ncbi:hypothetical protein K2F_13090 [Enterococcus thailandicus]|nr:hypothetical protein K2F_13090 [Enterococcus thailandicus]
MRLASRTTNRVFFMDIFSLLIDFFSYKLKFYQRVWGLSMFLKKTLDVSKSGDVESKL